MICSHEGCTQTATYGYKQQKREFCRDHKKDGMVTKSTQYCSHNVLKSVCETCRDIKNDKKIVKKDDDDNSCKNQGCISIIYGYRQNAPTKCKHHKLEDMVTHPLKYCEHNKRKNKCDICKKLCVHNNDKNTCDECNKRCSHNNIVINCKKCKVENKKQREKQRCDHGHLKRNCRECNPDGFCLHNKRRNQCKDCTGSSMCKHGRQKHSCKDCKGNYICSHNKQKGACIICNPSRKCKSDLCETMATNPIYKGYCTRCFVHLFPNEKVSKNYKTKEKTVVDIILQKFDKFTWTCDKIVDGGCSKRRPDMYLDLGSHIVIIEIDENSHKEYDCMCSNKRLVQLSQDFAYRPIVFIRFNPDGYIDIHNKYMYSPWKICKSTGIQILDQSKKDEWELRMDILCNTIQYWLENHTNKTIEVIELFYDKYIHKVVEQHYENKEKRKKQGVYSVNQRKVKDRPSLQQLLEDLKEIGNFKGVGEKYDVCDNTIRKWLTAYKYEVKCEICDKSVKSFGKMCSKCRKNRTPSLEQLEAELQELKTYKLIGQKYNVDRRTVAWWFEKRRSENKK